MTTPVIIDVIMAVVLIAAVIYGAHRGLFRAGGIGGGDRGPGGGGHHRKYPGRPGGPSGDAPDPGANRDEGGRGYGPQSQEVQMPEEDVDEASPSRILLA